MDTDKRNWNTNNTNNGTIETIGIQYIGIEIMELEKHSFETVQNQVGKQRDNKLENVKHIMEKQPKL
ncbi:hypothetical protein G210_2749 [Candida maltosa Xu316]|uniref:Uncharacterized protein n=1 Tax=Candida maltosa (strain Xu316) TaxID=1245528 RepID=M3JVP4_CANMX|nr:hypothetical protein G210_2749 [Candida maltosa Xu316]